MTVEVEILFSFYRYIIFHVLDESQQEGNESLGQAIIDLDTFDPNKGYHETLKLADLVSKERVHS